MIDCPACHVPPWGGAAATGEVLRRAEIREAESRP